MKEISLKQLLESGCHFGHQTTRWHPKMSQYIFTARDNVHIFDLAKTKLGLEKACEYITQIVSNGEKIIFVGTKRQAQDIIKEAAVKVEMPFVTLRWIGGTLTNWIQVKKRLDHLQGLKDGKVEGKFKKLTKKENLMIDREIAKLELRFGGITSLTKLPSAIFVVDARKDISAIREARNRGIKVIAVVDTNTNPDLVDYVIPANDDANRSIQLLVDYIVEAVEDGKKEQSKIEAKAKEPVKKEEIKETAKETVKAELKTEIKKEVKETVKKVVKKEKK